MIHDILKSINGIEIFPIIALILFIVVFLAIVIWTLRLDKSYINEMKQLPLDSTRLLPVEKHTKS